MYSAGDSSGDGLSGLNQFATMSGPIDWAAMAQQWIQMHDTGNLNMSMPDAPPPPNISTINTVNMKRNNMATAIPTPITTAATNTTKKSFEEQGEADMDMDEDEEHAKGKESPPPPAPSMRLGKQTKEQTIMQSQQQPWYLRQQNSGIVPPVANNLAAIDFDNTISQAATAASQWGANVWPPQINLPPPTAASLLNVPLNASIPNPTTHIPSLLKLNVPNPNATRMMTPNITEQNSEAAAMDAKKRKMLPAWIREGLEKMEREKQRQLEREQSKKQYEAVCIDTTSNIIGSVGTPNIPTHTVNMNYNQYAENDRSGNEDEDETNDFEGIVVDTSKLRKKSNEDDGSGVSDQEYEAENDNTTEPLTQMGNRSYEDRLSELMIVVRTTLTELLLEVTNKEIANLAQEAINAGKAKGLAAYDDSTGDEITDSEDEAHADSDQNNDSEEEIKASIRTKRRAFAKITDEIEERIAANAAREEQKLKYYCMLEKQEQEQKEHSNIISSELERKEDNPSTQIASTALANTVSKPYERDFGETSETKLQPSNGKRQKDRNSRKERTTRFSDNKDSKGAAAIAASYISKMHSTNHSGNSSGSNNLFPSIDAATTSSTGMAELALAIAAPSTIITPPIESSHKSAVFALDKHLLHAAEAAYEKATKSRRVSTSRSSVSRSDRERSYHSSHYDHKDHKSDRYRESEYERERKRDRNRDRYNERDYRDRKSVRRDRRDDDSHAPRKHKSRHSSDEDVIAVDCDDDKRESQTSSDTDSSSSSSSSASSSTSHHSNHSHSRTSSRTSKQRHENDHSRRYERRDERKERDRKSDRSRSPSRSRQRSHYHNQRSSSKRYSSAEDDYDNDSRYRHSSSRRDSSKKRSRSRSRSTYSSSSYRRRH